PAGTATDGSTDITNTAPPLVLEDVMPNDIRFNLGSGASSAGTDGNGWVAILTFLPDGSCDSDKTIRLELDGARPIEVSVRALSGTVTATKLPAGSGP